MPTFLVIVLVLQLLVSAMGFSLENELEYVSVHDKACADNSTHCNCNWAPGTGKSVCYRQLLSRPGRCYKQSCRGGLRCDCSSEWICRKRTMKYNRARSGQAAGSAEVECTREQKRVPGKVVRKELQFQLQALDVYGLYVGGTTVAFEISGEYRNVEHVASSGDVIEVYAMGAGRGKYGIKMRFTDMLDRNRTFDGRWKCSNETELDWRDAQVKASAFGWRQLSNVNPINAGDAFDSKTPWKWLKMGNTLAKGFMCLFRVP